MSEDRLGVETEEDEYGDYTKKDEGSAQEEEEREEIEIAREECPILGYYGSDDVWDRGPPSGRLFLDNLKRSRKGHIRISSAASYRLWRDTAVFRSGERSSEL